MQCSIASCVREADLGTLIRAWVASFGARVLAAALLVLPAASMAADSEVTAGEQQIKVAFLYKFGSYVEWPPNVFSNAEAPLVIGVVGADDMADELTKTVAGRMVNGRPVVVRKLRRGAGAASVNILYVGRSEGARAAESIAQVKGHPVLVVTDSEAAFEQGGTINFVLDGGKVRFDVAPPSSEQGNLRISSRLLAVARKVVTGRPS
jgi:hypothetical protein